MQQIVWFKRDFRWTDHVPLQQAVESSNPFCCLFIYEPMLINAPAYSNRHWKFMKECYIEVQAFLNQHQVPFYVLQGDVIDILHTIHQAIGDFTLLSHEEVGILSTYERDKKVKKWMKERFLTWLEFPQYGVQRGRKNRNQWDLSWKNFMFEPIKEINWSIAKPLHLPLLVSETFTLTHQLEEESKEMQIGGRKRAERCLQSFLSERVKNYSNHISKPQESRNSCSRLSPHLAWGSISIREVVQASYQIAKNTYYKRSVENFISRLHWHCHFIQKLESDPMMEVRNQNPAYNAIRNKVNAGLYERWTTGQTGIPLIDACMRCVKETGYLNFRMRAMVVSFWTHHLFQPWQAAAQYLAAQFLDFEPGIHFAQMQMQAGTVGYHTMRVYNPTNNAEKHDPNTAFIKKWVPELAALPNELAITPWKITPMEEIMMDFILGVHYPHPICNLEEAARFAKTEIHKVKTSLQAQMYARQISAVHVNQKSHKR